MSSTSSSQHEHSFNNNPEETKNYIPLFKAARQGDWKEAERFFEKYPDAKVASISSILLTALHVSAMSGRILFVKEMVKLMPKNALAHKDVDGYTALHSAVAAGKTESAKVMVEKNPDLTQMRANCGETPILRAARRGHKDLLWYLCSVTRDEDPDSPFRGEDGVELLKTIIVAKFYDVALYLIESYPHLATTTDQWNQYALHALAEKTSAFKSGSGLVFWQLCIYSRIPVEQTSNTKHHRSGDTENPPVSSRENTNMSKINQVLQRLNGKFWDAIKLVPSIKNIYDTKVMNAQASELLKCFCKQVSHMNNQEEMLSLLCGTTMLAAEYGNVEVLKECIEINPEVSLVKNNDTDENILHVAIMHRQEKVFNFIRKMGPSNSELTGRIDNKQNTILHQAAKLGPVSKINVVSGAALQVQRELQWYQEVKKLVQPSYKEKANNSGKKPRILFSEEHKDLIEKGEKWMKDMASSSMVVATLIATVVFTAAFTVPGGNNGDSGTPIFLKAKWFRAFAISNAVALFSSLTSVVIFVSLLTSRYAEKDFLESLPRKLIIALFMLFVSIAAMMVTFSATHFIMLGHHLASIARMLSLLACVPVTLFAWLQLPLFSELICSTYGYNVFNR